VSPRDYPFIYFLRPEELTFSDMIRHHMDESRGTQPFEHRRSAGQIVTESVIERNKDRTGRQASTFFHVVKHIGG
jgi:hypothetical protein